MNIQADPLRDLIRRVFEGAGCDEAEAQCVAHHLVDANLCGHDSHGVIRVPLYLGYITEQAIRLGKQPEVVFESPSMVAVEGHQGFGQVIGEQTTSTTAAPCCPWRRTRVRGSRF